MNQKINKILIVWVLLLLLFRPSFIGESYNPVVFVLFVLCSFLLYNKIKQDKNISIQKISTFYILNLTLLYFFIQGIILSDAKTTVLNASILTICTSYIFYKILHAEEIQETILKYFIYIHTCLVLSAIITIIHFIIVGFDASQLLKIGLVYPDKGDLLESSGQFSLHTIYFPFTVVWSSFSGLGFELPRFIGLYREPGMAQIFFCTAFFLTYYIEIQHRKIVRSILFIGALLIFSTAGFLSLIVGYFVVITSKQIKISRLRFLTSMAILISAIVIGLYLPGHGVLEKVESDSGVARSLAFDRGIERLSNNLIFGEGYYSGFHRDSEGLLINDSFEGILGVSFQIGVVGLILYFFTWVYSLKNYSNFSALPIYLPCILTWLFSQSNYNDIFTMFLLMLNTKNYSITV